VSSPYRDGQQKIVLCVDDSATMQQVADITFRGTEFTYIGARSFDEGLDKAKSQRPILILADSHMPGQGKSGYDLCLALKSDAGTAGIPVVILIGNAAPYDSTRGVQVGADANLPKPWDTQTMLEKVTEIVGKAAAGVAKPGQAAAPPAPAPAAAAPAVPAAGTKSAPAAAAAASAAMPPRSATIMGMPTIKMPAGNTPPSAPPAAGAAAAAPAPPTKTSVMAVPPISPAGSGPGTSPSIRSPAPPPPAPVAQIAPSGAASRAPMVGGTPTKRSLLVERTLAKMAARLAEAAGLEPGSPELLALLKLSTEVIERIVWEVVPDLAEQIIRENLHDLVARRS
jgi:CheY-like chemotaxis protein